jgi:hypothetical protein
MTSQELAEGHYHVQSEFYSFSSIVRHIPSLLRVYPINLKRSLLFLLLNIAGKSTVKYIDTSLDWVDNNEKWNFEKIRPDDKVLKESTVFSSDKAHLPFQSLKDGSPFKNDEPYLNDENKIP